MLSKIVVFLLLSYTNAACIKDNPQEMSCYTHAYFDEVEPAVRILNLFDTDISRSDLKEFFPYLQQLNVFGTFATHVCALKLGLVTNCGEDYAVSTKEPSVRDWDEWLEQALEDFEHDDSDDEAEEISIAALTLALLAILAVGITIGYTVRRERTRYRLSRLQRAAFNERVLGGRIEMQADTTDIEVHNEDGALAQAENIPLTSSGEPSTSDETDNKRKSDRTKKAPAKLNL